MNKIFYGNLQLFADGGDGASVGIAEGSAPAGATEGQVAADTQVATDTTQTDAAELEAQYKSLISGDLKDVHKKHFESALNRRMRGKEKQIEELNGFREKTSPLLEKLAIKYGVPDPTNIDAILAASEQDDSYLDAYAMKHGVDNETAKQLIKADGIIAANERRLAEEQEQAEYHKQWEAWSNEAEQVKQFYPDFDWEAEMENDDFSRLIFSSVPMKTAYEVTHQNEIVGGAMQYAYDASKQEMADARTARSNRPKENGTSYQQASEMTLDYTKLSSEQRKKIRDAVARGEKINEHNIGSFI